MRITAVDCHVLLDPDFEPEATSSAQHTIVVEVHTDEEIVGIGETDLNAWVARALIEAPGTHTMDRGLGAMLIGENPLDPAAVWERLYVGTAMTGRRGAGVHALGAIDLAPCGRSSSRARSRPGSTRERAPHRASSSRSCSTQAGFTCGRARDAEAHPRARL